MNNFNFLSPNKIIFGSGMIKNAGIECQKFGSKVQIISGKSTNLRPIINSFYDHNLRYDVMRVSGEPELSTLNNLLKELRQKRIDVIVGIGGGSAIDYGKAIAALIPAENDIYYYLEVVGKGNPLKRKPIPFVAIPTTAGTGSEVTRNSVVNIPEKRVKISLRDEKMMPNIAIVDPDLTITLPSAITASSGLDALTQLIEPLLSLNSNPLTEILCIEGIEMIVKSISVAFKDGRDINARQNMALASLYGGLSLSNAGLGAVHGLAGPIGGILNAPHGVLCARLLPQVYELNYLLIQKNQPQNPVLKRFKKIAEILCGNVEAEIHSGTKWLKNLVDQLEIPKLTTYGLSPKDYPEIIKKAMVSSSMKNNPIKLSEDNMYEILNTSS